MGRVTDPRTLHYSHFYGLDEPEDTGPVALVVGNCQAESTRILLSGPDLTTIRMPAVHELTASDLPHLDRWLARASFLISQPVRDDYHGLPLGVRQLTARMPHGRTVTVPVIRFAGLYPTHVIVRPPRDASLVPPLVEYHDLLLLAEAAGAPVARPSVEVVRAVAAQSIAELTRREEAHDTITVSDLFANPSSFDLMRTINHPGNAVFEALAGRVRARLGLSERVADPGRPLLNRVHAPRLPVVVEAFGLPDAPRDHWVVDGADVSAEIVRREHLEWYAANPDIVEAGVARHAPTLALFARR